jgi:hypothetical protein
MPHSSQIGRPKSRKYSSTSIGVGAAPTISHSHWSRPSFCRMAAFCSSGSALGSVTPCASRAALIFSQMRGTEPQIVGRTCGRCCTIIRASAMQVTVQPKAIEPW